MKIEAEVISVERHYAFLSHEEMRKVTVSLGMDQKMVFIVKPHAATAYQIGRPVNVEITPR